jgi:ATP-dependent Clp protease adaptor protein ClpS
MAEKETNEGAADNAAGAAVQTKPAKKHAPKKSPPKLLPQWKVLLHNDDVNVVGYVINTIVMLTPLNEDQALQRTVEADKTGVALLLVTHKERAELYQEQFQSKGLTVTIEPAE